MGRVEILHTKAQCKRCAKCGQIVYGVADQDNEGLFLYHRLIPYGVMCDRCMEPYTGGDNATTTVTRDAAG